MATEVRRAVRARQRRDQYRVGQLRGGGSSVKEVSLNIREAILTIKEKLETFDETHRGCDFEAGLPEDALGVLAERAHRGNGTDLDEDHAFPRVCA